MERKEDIEKLFERYDSDTPEFNLKGCKTYGRVVDIVDGDTMVVVLPLFDKYYKFCIRLSGIDTFELKSKNQRLHEVGLKARNRVLEIISCDENITSCNRKDLQKICKEEVFIVWVECLDYDKYGRVLANIFKDKNELSISKILLNEKLAYEYSGGTKLTEEEQLNLLN